MKLSVLRRTPDSTAPDPAPPGAPKPGIPWRRLIELVRPPDLRAALRANAGMKLTSIVLAFFLWFSINVTERDAERVVELPVTVRKLEKGLIVTNLSAKPVSVTLRGPRTILDGVDEHRTRFSLELTEPGPSDERVELSADMLKPELPRRLKVVRIDPPRVRVRVDRLVRRMLPVRLDLVGTTPLGYMVGESHVAPSEVEVTGPAAKVDELKEITTESLDLRGQKENVERSIALAWVGDFVSFAPDHVTVNLSLEEVMVSRDFHVDVRVANGGQQRVQVTPSTADVTVHGPQRLLHNFKLSSGDVYVDAAGLPPGTHRVSLHVDVPAPLEVTARRPETHVLTIGKGGR
jgi:YbbR domain-containing protein